MWLWVDDLRVPTVDWVWAKTSREAKNIIDIYRDDIELLSLDHDLGGDDTCYSLVLWMAEHDIWPAGEIRIHSANPVGRENMAATILRYGPYRQRPDLITFVRES
jgi:hypothetical protein